ncbi:MAG: ATP-binding protein [Calditrichaceae bacterium]|nr:ATP-binding protein [Calditrichaceae bacterium]MBN2709302.1 ATP-binding protein [Calditrichaceae bacterium]RQV92001.1 MAG: ATPase [Calditrichota bacterium]
MKIAIASGKGGTGKTTLSTNLAGYLSKQYEVVLVDLDVEEPNSGLFMNGPLILSEDKYKMIPEWVGKCSMCGLCQQVCKFNAIVCLEDEIMVFPELCHSCYACSELCPESALPMFPQKMGELKHFRDNHLSFVESRLDIGQEQAVPLIAQTHKYIDEHFNAGFVRIMDAPPGTSCPVIEAVKKVDFVILVTEPTPFGLHDLKLAVETMKALNKKFGVVINRFGIGNDDVISYCKEEGIDILAKIPNDRRIAELYSRGELIYDKFPEFTEQLERIKKYIFTLN